MRHEGDFVSAVNSLDIGFSTNHDIGMLWGARTLEPGWSPFFDQDSRPWNDEDYPKYLVYLSDGRSVPIGYQFGDYNSRNESSVTQTTINICNYLKDKDVIIYGISYSSNNQEVDAVKQCSSENLHFHADGLSLETVFTKIAVDIKNRGIRINR